MKEVTMCFLKHSHREKLTNLYAKYQIQVGIATYL